MKDSCIDLDNAIGKAINTALQSGVFVGPVIGILHTHILQLEGQLLESFAKWRAAQQAAKPKKRKRREP